MKTKQDTAATVRAIIRWTTGTVVAVALTTGACFLFPLLSNLGAFALTLCLSAFIGLNIALPPLDPEDDWVPVRSRVTEMAEKKQAVAIPETRKAASEEPAPVEPIPGIEVLPVHRRRANGAPTGTWHVVHPGLNHAEEAHRITLNHHRDRRNGTRQHEHSLSEKSG